MADCLQQHAERRQLGPDAWTVDSGARVRGWSPGLVSRACTRARGSNSNLGVKRCAKVPNRAVWAVSEEKDGERDGRSCGVSEPRPAPTVGQVVLGRRLLDLRERVASSGRRLPAS